MKIAIAALIAAQCQAKRCATPSFWSEARADGQSLDAITAAPPLHVSTASKRYGASYAGERALYEHFAVNASADVAAVHSAIDAAVQLRRSPRVVRFLGCVEGDGYVGVFTAFHGQSLGAEIENYRAKPPKERFAILYNAARALFDFHEMGFVHGRVAAESFYFSETPSEVIIGDFSRARKANGSAARLADARDFAAMALALESETFRVEYAALLKSGNAPSERLRRLAKEKLIDCPKAIRTAAIEWLGNAFGRSDSPISQIVARFEAIEKARKFRDGIAELRPSKTRIAAFAQTFRSVQKIIKLFESEKPISVAERTANWLYESVELLANRFAALKSRAFIAFAELRSDSKAPPISTPKIDRSPLTIEIESVEIAKSPRENAFGEKPKLIFA